MYTDKFKKMFMSARKVAVRYKCTRECIDDDPSLGSML